MRKLLIFIPVLLVAQAPPKPQSTNPKPAVAPGLTTDDEKTIYALGLTIYRSLSQFDLSPTELEIMKRGMADAAAGKPAEDLNTWGPKIQAFARARSARGLEREKAASNAYLENAAAEPGTVKTESGLIYREVKAGTGLSPKATDTVKVNYRGTLVNGTEFDNTYTRNEPAQFALNTVISCWSEGLQKMKVDGKATLICPPGIAYGDRGRPGIPGGAALIFDIELLDIVPAPAPANQ
ncbi:MAG: FKBP-type peptidyl-prolyl cis-trans isomerase [Acidobacteriaceae bacterium]|nr:FKBP-type peptidyl-prolyl cis-trans isomerase [Acidobacteriaceae bacterium]MBV9780820.1 FKBP-type peptidyl-prolyl cis-trans isomerase [Acidobacteriaceae bacterium]